MQENEWDVAMSFEMGFQGGRKVRCLSLAGFSRGVAYGEGGGCGEEHYMGAV